MVIVSRFTFKQSSDNLFGRHGRQRKKSIKSKKRQKSNHIPAHTQAVIMARRKGSFRKTFHSEWIVRHTKHCVGTLSQAASEHLLNKLFPLAACALSPCLLVGRFAEMLVISPATEQDGVAMPTVVKGGCIVPMNSWKDAEEQQKE